MSSQDVQRPVCIIGLGLDEDQVGYIIDNDEDWPSDMLLRIAGELGFGDELEDFIDGLDSDDS